jgi:hypothetical protein
MWTLQKISDAESLFSAVHTLSEQQPRNALNIVIVTDTRLV